MKFQIPKDISLLLIRNKGQEKNKKAKIFDRHLEITFRGIHKGKNKDQCHEKNKENMDWLLKEQ